jgi:hypothetical protein
MDPKEEKKMETKKETKTEIKSEIKGKNLEVINEDNYEQLLWLVP